MSSPADSPIFVGGTGRSGTSILRHLLSKHPEIYAFRYESRFIVEEHGLLHVLESDRLPAAMHAFRAKMLGEWYRRVFREGTPGEYVGGLWTDVDRDTLERLLDELERELLPSAPREARLEAARAFIRGVFAKGMAERGKSRFLDKTPSNLLYMRELLELFPAAKLIHILRDGRDVVASILDNQFWPINPRLLLPNHGKLKKTVRNGAVYWREFLRYGLRLGRSLPDGAYLEVRLEDLVADPETTLERICEHVGVEPDPRIAASVDAGRAHVGRWRDAMSPDEVAEFEEEAGDLLAELGYGP